MAINNSFARVHGAFVVFSPGMLSSFARVLGAFGDIDSSSTIAPRVLSYLQRAGENIGDLSGKIYNTDGSPITLTAVNFSKVGASGPWLPATILSSDPAYSFPTIGTPSGEAFNVPVETIEDFTGGIWFQLEVTY